MTDAAQALQDLAEALESGDQPDILEVKEALNSFRASKLEKSVQTMVAEAREAAKAGRMPDALLIRMIARGMTGESPSDGLRNVSGGMMDPVEQAALEEKPKRRGRPPGSKNKPRGIVLPTVTTVAEREVLPSGVGLTKVRVVPLVHESSQVDVVAEELLELHRGDKELESFYQQAVDDDADHGEKIDEWNGKKIVLPREILHDSESSEEASECLACGERPPEDGEMTCMQCRVSDEMEKEEQKIVVQSFKGWAASLDPVTKAKMLEREVDRVIKTLPPSWTPDSVDLPVSYDDDDEDPNPPSGPNGHPLAAPRLTVVDATEEDRETPAELVARAAGALDESHNADLISALYELAGKLESLPADPETLLERTEREIERRIERALKSSADLPEWVVRWAERKRNNGTYGWPTDTEID